MQNIVKTLGEVKTIAKGLAEEAQKHKNDPPPGSLVTLQSLELVFLSIHRLAEEIEGLKATAKTGILK